MDEFLKRLVEARQRAWDQAKTIVDTAEAEKRDLTGEEQAEFDRISTEIDEKRQQIDVAVERREAERKTEESLRRLGVAGSGQPDDASRGGAADMDTAFRRLGAGEIRSIDISAADLGKAMSSRALVKGTPAAGGALVPTSFYDRLVEHMVESSGLLQLGPTVINTTTGENLVVPVTTGFGSGALVAENGTIGGTDPAFAQRTLGAYKYGQLVLVSTELITDEAFNLADFIARVAGRNVGLALGTHLVTGTGTAQPTGVVTSASTGKTGSAGAAGAFTADDLIDLMFSVIAPYRASSSAGWLVKDSTLGAIRKLKDGAGRYLFDAAATVGAPDTLLGKPIRTDPNVAAVGVGAKSVVFGDWSAYFVRYAGGVRFERSDEFKFDTDQVAFRAIVRADGITADQTGALKVFVGGAA